MLLPPKLHVCTPMYGGLATGTYIESLIRLVNLTTLRNIHIAFTFIYNESLITRARNRCCDDFLKRTDDTHLLWIDADIGFKPEDVLMMLQADKDIIGAACVKKSLNWDRIKYLIHKNGKEITPAELMAVSGDFVVHFLQPEKQKEVKLDEPLEVDRLGTGLLLVKREVFTKMKESYPDRYYSPLGDVACLEGPIHEFFQARIEPNTRQYLSEDYAFCDDAKSLGFHVWLAPWVKSSHTGSFTFEGDLNAVALATGSL